MNQAMIPASKTEHSVTCDWSLWALFIRELGYDPDGLLEFAVVVKPNGMAKVIEIRKASILVPGANVDVSKLLKDRPA